MPSYSSLPSSSALSVGAIRRYRTYTAKPEATFVNLDMIGYVPADQPSRYPSELLHFFADIEREWVSLGGMPHNGKMYGFYDPGAPRGSYSPPFNPSFSNL